MPSISISRRSLGLAAFALGFSALPAHSAARRARVIVSSDIGGSDPDDFQSMVHLFLSADRFDLEGVISSPWGTGEKKHILEVIDQYEKDYPNLKTYSSPYPTPERLRQISKQGGLDRSGYSAVGKANEGSDWIIARARVKDPRPLHLLVWGGIDDLAQALHDAPDILPKLRVYFIGGPNKKWSADAYQYIADHHPTLWIIEANSTYRGWFTGGDQSGDWGNTSFVAAKIANQGALGSYFSTHLAGTIKMGDSPSVGWILSGMMNDPSKDGWGGHFVRAWDRPFALYNRTTSADDRIEQFGVIEWRLPVKAPGATPPVAIMKYENQVMQGYWDGANMRFRVCPRDIKVNSFVLESDHPELSGLKGAFTSFAPSPDNVSRPSTRYPNWWTDDPNPVFSEGEHQGAKTVSQWRHAILEDFARSIARCQNPKTS